MRSATANSIDARINTWFSSLSGDWGLGSKSQNNQLEGQGEIYQTPDTVAVQNWLNERVLYFTPLTLRLGRQWTRPRSIGITLEPDQEPYQLTHPRLVEAAKFLLATKSTSHFMFNP